MGEMTNEQAARWLKDLLKSDLPMEQYQTAIEKGIEALEQRTGHWIWCVGSHKCSNCEEYTCFSHKELLRYCPNCGAKMESEG